MEQQDAQSVIWDMINYIDASPTATHATVEMAQRLEAMGFKRLNEEDAWDLKPGDCFYVIRNYAGIIAARVGAEPPETGGCRIIGAHTDFPGLRLKPNGVYSKNGYLQLGVEVYGGPILHTWLNRDLGLAGRIVVGEDGVPGDVMLFEINRPVCHIPNLAPHIRVKRTEEIKLNRQDHFPPILGLGDKQALEEKPLLKAVAAEAGVDVDEIISCSIEVFDLQPGTTGGMNEEFVFSRSLDNLSSCHAGLEALKGAPTDAPFTQIIALFDNEEIGSGTMQGAQSGFLDSVIERLCIATDRPREAFHRTLANSLLFSVDGAHAVNPNYSSSHEPRHHPMLNGGPVVKVNANERYTTQLEAHAHLKACAAAVEAPLQTFVARTDVGTGSTIGPMTSTRLGIRSVDVGSPMLSMHSSREVGGVEDQLHMIRLLTEHFTRL
ncbi:MAG: M18 family aminopeptidase [bacterium]|nr:M18 family aminopeptidase [bacterium]